MAGLVNPDPGFWRGRRVLVTGHSGFKGSWLGLWLARLGAVPLGLSLPAQDEAESERLGFLDGIMPGVACDIRDGQAVQAALKRSAPEIVLHLAAQPLVRRSYRDPHLTFETNVMGTLNLLEAVRLQPSVRSVVIATTDKCYENREWPWAYRESDPLGGHDPYSASKACTEILAASWRNSFAASLDRPIAIATVRAGNVIGGGDWAQDRLVPDAVRAFACGQSLALRNPQATRPWQHVLDALCGYLLLTERLHTGTTVSRMPGISDPTAAPNDPSRRCSKRWPGFGAMAPHGRAKGHSARMKRAGSRSIPARRASISAGDRASISRRPSR